MNWGDIFLLLSIGLLIGVCLVAFICVIAYFYRHKITIWLAEKKIVKAIECLKAGKTEDDKIANLIKAGIKDYLIVQKANERIKKEGGQDGNTVQQKETEQPTIGTGDGGEIKRGDSSPARQRYIPAKTSTFSRQK